MLIPKDQSGKTRAHAGWWRTPLRVVLTVLGTNAALMLLLGLTYAIPNGPIIEKVNADFQAGRLNEDYPGNRLGGTLDGFTQCLGVSSGVLPVDSDISIPMRVSMVPRSNTPCASAAEAFALLATNGPFEDADTSVSHSYTRYWSGYSIISRPALALGGVRLVQAVTGLLLVGASGLLAWSVYRRVGGLPAAALVGTYLLTTNTLGTPRAFTQGIAEAVLLAGAAVVLLVPRKWILPAAAAAASTFVFVDLLTVPSSSWALTAFLVGVRAWTEWVGREPSPEAGRLWLKVGKASGLGMIAWGFGYATTWGMRWLVAMIYSDPGAVVRNVLWTAQFRMDGDTTSTGVVLPVVNAPLATIRANLSAWKAIPGGWYALVIFAIALVCLYTMRKQMAERGGIATLAMLILPSLLVPLWYEVMRNHSQLHAWFTHRSLGMALAIVVASMAIVAAGKVVKGRAGSEEVAQPPAPESERLDDLLEESA